MKLDEFAFFNQQLAGMLRAGLPLEGGLRQLTATMARGGLRNELEALRADLEKGVPLDEAVRKRSLPPLYVALVQAGAKGGQLPGILTMLGDHYNQLAATTARLKGLMVYPLIILLLALLVSFFLAFVQAEIIKGLMGDLIDSGVVANQPVPLTVWLPVGVVGLMTALWMAAVFVPALRQWVRWQVPALRDISLAQAAGTMSMLLQGGTTLANALTLLREAEGGSPAGRELAQWLALHQQGQARFEEFTLGSRVFPPLFRWLVAQGGDNLAEGFQRAGEIYQARARHKTELLLYAAMPVAIMLLAALIVGQMFPVVQSLTTMIYMLGG